MELEGGCYVPVTHKLNQDGYFRKTWGSVRAKRYETEFFHRFIYRAHNNLTSIPDGQEIDHLCRNRACCAPSHLRLIDRPSHAILTNQQRKIDCDAAGIHYGTRSNKRLT